MVHSIDERKEAKGLSLASYNQWEFEHTHTHTMMKFVYTPRKRGWKRRGKIKMAAVWGCVYRSTVHTQQQHKFLKVFLCCVLLLLFRLEFPVFEFTHTHTRTSGVKTKTKMADKILVR